MIKFVFLTDVGFWRAYLDNAHHCGGMGETPEEALGWLLFNHPHRFGVNHFDWVTDAPMDSVYPEGAQNYT